MIQRRKFLKLFAGGMVVSQWPGTLLGGWGQAAPYPSETLIPKKSIFTFDELLEQTVRLALLSVDGSGMHAIQQQSMNMPWFEALPCAENDAQLEDTLAAIGHLRTKPEEAINLYLFAQGTSENLPRVAKLAMAARLIDAFVVALIIETEETDSAQWSMRCAESGINSLCLVSPGVLGPDAAILAPHLVHQPLELAYLTALRAHSDLIWNIGMIGIDYADFQAVIGGRKMSRLGTGNANGATRGERATQMALHRLFTQGFELAQGNNIWVTIYAGNDLTMEEFDEVYRVIHGVVAEETNVVVGIFLGEEFSERVTVTILAGLSPYPKTTQIREMPA